MTILVIISDSVKGQPGGGRVFRGERGHLGQPLRSREGQDAIGQGESGVETEHRAGREANHQGEWTVHPRRTIVKGT